MNNLSKSGLSLGDILSLSFRCKYLKMSLNLATGITQASEGIPSTQSWDQQSGKEETPFRPIPIRIPKKATNSSTVSLFHVSVSLLAAVNYWHAYLFVSKTMFPIIFRDSSNFRKSIAVQELGRMFVGPTVSVNIPLGTDSPSSMSSDHSVLEKS